MSELNELFLQGDTELFGTAAERCRLLRAPRLGHSAGSVELSAVISPAEVAWELQSPGGSTVTCDTVAVIRRCDLPQRPSPGDRLVLPSGTTYELVRVTGWTHGTTWHLDLTLRRA